MPAGEDGLNAVTGRQVEGLDGLVAGLDGGDDGDLPEAAVATLQETAKQARANRTHAVL